MAILLNGLLLPCVVAGPEEGQVARARKQQAAVWIDVRTPEEYAKGHLEGAANIPYDQIGKHIAKLVPDKHTEIRLYCRSGRRSELARQTLLDLGYTKVFNEGAYEKLRKERETPARE